MDLPDYSQLADRGRSRTLSITILTARPVSFWPSGLAESPLPLIGLVLRLSIAGLQLGLDVFGFNRLGMMRTMATAKDEGRGGVFLRAALAADLVTQRGVS